MEELLNLIKEADNFYALDGVEPFRVEEAENELRLSFADDYKAYVLTFGAATFDGHELTGVCKSDRLSVVAATERAREFFPQFPGGLYVIEDLQFDYILIVQDAEGVVYSYGPDDQAKKIAVSLQEYLFPESINQETPEGDNPDMVL